jgi:hypothetical protein
VIVWSFLKPQQMTSVPGFIIAKMGVKNNVLLPFSRFPEPALLALRSGVVRLLVLFSRQQGCPLP